MFEDIIPALRGARRGGFITVGVREQKWKYTEEELAASCDYMVTDIRETIAWLAQRRLVPV